MGSPQSWDAGSLAGTAAEPTGARYLASGSDGRSDHVRRMSDLYESAVRPAFAVAVRLLDDPELAAHVVEVVFLDHARRILDGASSPTPAVIVDDVRRSACSELQRRPGDARPSTAARHAVQLAYVGRLSRVEIAQHMRCTPNVVDRLLRDGLAEITEADRGVASAAPRAAERGRPSGIEALRSGIAALRSGMAERRDLDARQAAADPRRPRSRSLATADVGQAYGDFGKARGRRDPLAGDELQD